MKKTSKSSREQPHLSHVAPIYNGSKVGEKDIQSEVILIGDEKQQPVFQNATQNTQQPAPQNTQQTPNLEKKQAANKNSRRTPSKNIKNSSAQNTPEPVSTPVPPKPDSIQTPPKPDSTQVPPKPDSTQIPPKPTNEVLILPWSNEFKAKIISDWQNTRYHGHVFQQKGITLFKSGIVRILANQDKGKFSCFTIDPNSVNFLKQVQTRLILCMNNTRYINIDYNYDEENENNQFWLQIACIFILLEKLRYNRCPISEKLFSEPPLGGVRMTILYPMIFYIGNLSSNKNREITIIDPDRTKGFSEFIISCSPNEKQECVILIKYGGYDISSGFKSTNNDACQDFFKRFSNEFYRQETEYLKGAAQKQSDSVQISQNKEKPTQSTSDILSIPQNEEKSTQNQQNKQQDSHPPLKQYKAESE